MAFSGLAFRGLAFRGFSTLPLAASPKAEHTEQQAEQFEHMIRHASIHATELRIPPRKNPPLSIQQQERVSVSYSVSRLSCRFLLAPTQPIPVTLRTTCRQAGPLIVAGVIHPSTGFSNWMQVFDGVKTGNYEDL